MAGFFISTPLEKYSSVRENAFTYLRLGDTLSGMTVSLVARRHGVAPNQLFTWRRLLAQGALTDAGSGEEVVPVSDGVASW
jgi:Transposase